MANMIIRPATGTGNKVIVQDQAGAAVLTTADSGGTIASGVTHTGPISSNATFPAGTPVQVQSTTKTSNFETSSTSITEVTGLNVAITPRFTGSKIFATASFSMANSQATAASHAWLRRKVASGSYASIGSGDAYGNRPAVGVYHMETDTRVIDLVVLQHLDAPSYTAGQVLTYSVAVNSPQGSGYNTFIGKNGADSNVNYQGRMPSTITVMEIAQ